MVHNYAQNYVAEMSHHFILQLFGVFFFLKEDFRNNFSTLIYQTEDQITLFIINPQSLLRVYQFPNQNFIVEINLYYISIIPFISKLIFLGSYFIKKKL